MTTNLPAPLPIQSGPPTYWRSTTGLRTALTWLFAADAVAVLFAAGARLHRVGVINDFESFTATTRDGRDADQLVSSASSIYFLLFIATATVLMVWMWKSAKNNELLGKVRPRLSPGWSIGGWFIPIANFVIPVRVFQDLFQGADPDTNGYRDWRGLKRSVLVGFWWTAYLLGNALTIQFGDVDTLDQIRQHDEQSAAGYAIVAVAAVLAIFVVRSITARQEAARANGRRSAGWYADPMGRFDHRYWNGSVWTVHVSRGGEATLDQLN